MKDTLWGGRCIQDSQCSVVSHCDGGMYFFLNTGGPRISG